MVQLVHALTEWASDLSFSYSEADVIKLLQFLLTKYLRGGQWINLSAISWLSNGDKLQPFTCRLISLQEEGGVYTRLLKAVNLHFAQKFNFTYRYIDDVLPLNNSKISGFIDLIYPCKLGCKIRQSPVHLPRIDNDNR